MADQTEINRLFPDTSLPSILPLPQPPETAEQSVSYLKILHHVLSDQQAKLVRALNVLKAYSVSIDPEIQKLQPIGSGRINIDPDTGYIWYDAPVRGNNLSESDILNQAEWKRINVAAQSITLAATSYGYAPSFGSLEPVVALDLQPNVCLGDSVVVRKIPPATTGATVDQPSDFLWTVEGDIVMSETNPVT